MKKLTFISILLILILLLPSIPASVHGAQNSTSNILKKPQILHVLQSASDKDPPRYYSFEAFQMKSPSTTPVVIPIAVNATFKSTGIVPKNFIVNIPKGNYSLAILNVTIRETGGPQYDRAFYVFANGIPLLWGSTQEIYNSTAQADVTYYLNLLQGSVNFQVVLTNYLAPQFGITGYYIVNVTLYLYSGTPMPGLPNYFIPLYLNPFNYSMATLTPFSPSKSQSLTIPTGTYRIAAVFYTEGAALDEFWYANEPAPRPLLVYYNGFLGGVVLPYETIYTGGIDPFYWRPVTSINTLAFHSAHFIDLTPLLATGSQATINIFMYNLEQAYALTGSPYFRWLVSGALLLWVNSSNPLISGNLISSNARFLDSSPLFFFDNPLGIVYQEAGSFFVNNTAILNFMNGKVISSVIQYGKFSAYQTFNSIFEYAKLDEEYHERAIETGMYSASLSYDIRYPIELNYGFVAVPITNPNVIPFNATFAQNGTISLGLYYDGVMTYGNFKFELKQNESLYSYGGFSGILEIINPYGGAILLGLTSNFAQTTKRLTAIYTINGVGWKEVFFAIGQISGITQRAGSYIALSIQYFNVGYSPSEASNQKVGNSYQSFLLHKLETLRKL